MTRNERIKLKKTVKILGYISFVLILMVFIPLIIAVFVDNLINKLVIYEIICVFLTWIVSISLIANSNILEKQKINLQREKTYFYFGKIKKLLREEKYAEAVSLFTDKFKDKGLLYFVVTGYLLAKLDDDIYLEIIKSKTHEK